MKIVDIALGLASRLPVNAFSDWLSGALLLVRRTLVPVCGGVGPAASTGQGGAGCGLGSGTAIPNTIKVDVNRAPALTYTVERWIAPSSDGQGNWYRRPGALFRPSAVDPDGDSTRTDVLAPPVDDGSSRPPADVGYIDIGNREEGITFRIKDDGRAGVAATVVATDGTDSSTALHWVTRQGPDGSIATPPAAPTLTISDRDPVTGGYVITPTAGAGVNLAVTSNAPAFGSLVANGDGSYTYTPLAERMGDADTVRFTGTDGAGSTSSSSVRFTVLPGKDPATAVPVLTGSADQDPYVSLIFGVSDPRTGAVTITPVFAPAISGKGVRGRVIDGPSHGSLRSTIGGGFRYTPTDLKGVGATDTFQFEFNDGKDTVILPLYVDIAVTDVNHPPVLQLTKSTPQSYTGYRVVDIAPLAVDPDGEPVTVAVTGYLSSTAKQGVTYRMPLGEIYYKEPLYGFGDAFHYQIDKGVRSGTTADVTITATDSRGLTTSMTTTIVVP